MGFIYLTADSDTDSDTEADNVWSNTASDRHCDRLLQGMTTNTDDDENGLASDDPQTDNRTPSVNNCQQLFVKIDNLYKAIMTCYIRHTK